MAEPKKKETNDAWEDMKSLGSEVDSICMWTAVELFGRTEKTISQAKFPGAKFYWTPAGCLIEHKGRRESVPQAGVAKVKWF